MKNPLNNAPSRLLRMLLKLQRYNLVVTYEKRTTILLADTLSHTHLSCVNVCEFASKLESVDHTVLLAVSENRLQQIKHASANDSVLTTLRHTIQQGWPNDKRKVPSNIRVYYDYRDELIV